MGYLHECLVRIVIPMSDMLKDLMTLYKFASEIELFSSMSLRFFHLKDKVNDEDQRNAAIETKKLIVNTFNNQF